MTRPTLRWRASPDPRARVPVDGAGRLLGIDPTRLRRAITTRELLPIKNAKTGQDELVIEEVRLWMRTRKAA
jgi:hypothetical protein